MRMRNLSGVALIGLLTGGIAAAATMEPKPADASPFWIAQIGEMSVARAAHQATILPSGQVLITGGCAAPGCERVLASAEIYDPATRSFRRVADMATPRDAHAAAALPNGRVLVAGGWTGRRRTATAEVYDPSTDRWTSAGDMVEVRTGPIAAPLPDGRVLIVGGSGENGSPLAAVEIFDPASMTFSTVGRMSVARTSHAVVVLADGRVLITGGRSSGSGSPLRSAEIYDPAIGEFQPTGDLIVARHKHAAELLPDRRVLIMGGSDRRDWDGKYSSTEIYDPDTGEFSAGPEMRRARFKIRDAVVTLPLLPYLRSGGVLVAGGAARPELYLDSEEGFGPVFGEPSGPRMFGTATLLSTGEVLILGGYDNRVRPTASAALFYVNRAGT